MTFIMATARRPGRLRRRQDRSNSSLNWGGNLLAKSQADSKRKRKMLPAQAVDIQYFDGGIARWRPRAWKRAMRISAKEF
jgi:hypothetical protein